MYESSMKKLIYEFQSFLEKIDSYRDKALFVFIKPYWPRKITPNHVTYIRLVIGIILFVLLLFFGIEDKALIFTLFAIGVVTDFIDGPIARGTNQVTEFGAMLDSTSDRFLFIPIAIYALYKTHPWLLIVLMFVELANAIVSIYFNSKEIYLESNIFGKVKMVLLCIVLLEILLIWPKSPSVFFTSILWLTVLLSVLSASVKILDLKKQPNGA